MAKRVDGGRAYVVKAQLTKGVDGAALAAARMLNSGNPRAEAEGIFKANFPYGAMGTTGDPTTASDFFSLTTDEPNGLNIVQIRASAVMPTTFMRLANIPDVTVGAFAETTRRMVDLCLVLDTSGSLGWRWPFVRDAAMAFVRAFDETFDRLCFVKYSSGAEVPVPITTARGFNKTAVLNAISSSSSGGVTSMRRAYGAAGTN